MMKGHSNRLRLPPIVAVALLGSLHATAQPPAASAQEIAPQEGAEAAENYDAPVETPAEAPADAPAGKPETIQPADPEALAAWIRDLDDDRYSVREAAQKQIATAGLAALDTVAETAANGSLESSTRALAVLIQWAEAKDTALRLAALERVAALANRPTEAAMASDRLADVRQAAAVIAIKELGGRFDSEHAMGMVAGTHAPVQVVIGPKWKGGVEGLRHVAAIRDATRLSLYSAPLDDAAVSELAKIRQVKRIEIFGTALSPQAIAKLQEQLPQTLLDVRSGARLGISGLIIDRVVVGSPAEKAGLRPQDKITEFAGKPIESFEQLTQEIARCKPGEVAKIKVLRQDPATGQPAPLELTVTFDRWGDDERPINGVPGQDPFAQAAQIRRGLQRTIIINGGRIQGLPQPVPPARNLDRR